jgi:putative ABC transport system permease protein
MIRNYFIIALRNLWRNKLITMINLTGMAIGFGIFLSFWTWVRYEVSFDRFNEDIDNMYMLYVRFTTENGSDYTSERTGGIFAGLLEEQFSQVESSCRVSQPLQFEIGIPSEDTVAGVAMKYYDEDEVLAVDSSFFHFYSFPLVEGNINTLFSERDHIVITESLAEKLFGDQEVMGRQVRIGKGAYFVVAGVAEDPPETSSFQFRALLGFHVMEELGYPVDGIGGTIFYTNFKIRPGTDIAGLNRSINYLVKQRAALELDTYFYLDSFKRMHLYGESRQITSVYLDMIMALVILSIASINFINLTTASYSSRLKEIAIRKSAGAGKRQLLFQFLGETYLMLLLAFYLGFFVAEQLIPFIDRAFGIFPEKIFSGRFFWAQMLLLYLLTGLLAGLYPAIKISGFRPKVFLSGKSDDPYRGSSRIRKILIVVQFIFSVIFILVSILMIRQYDYLKEADLGFNRKDVIYIRTKGRAWDLYALIKKDLEMLPFVQGVTSGSEIPVMIQSGELDWGEREGDHNQLAVVLWTDADFLSTFEIGLEQGEYFSEERDSLNKEYVVVNQSLADLMGWEEPVGSSFFMWGEDLTVLGVTENFDFFPFNLAVFGDKALIYRYESVGPYIFVRVTPELLPEQMAAIEKVFRTHNPGYEYEYDFVSDYQYPALENSEGIQLVFNLFSIIAVFIALMGLIGLSFHNSHQRTKEVGIRKVMGAHTGMIMQLLLSDFLKLVVLSNLIALPASYLIIRRLLQIFSYSIDLKVSTFLLVFLVSVVISLATVSIHAIRTASSNPVESLRYE